MHRRLKVADDMTRDQFIYYMGYTKDLDHCTHLVANCREQYVRDLDVLYEQAYKKGMFDLVMQARRNMMNHPVTSIAQFRQAMSSVPVSFDPIPDSFGVLGAVSSEAQPLLQAVERAQIDLSVVNWKQAEQIATIVAPLLFPGENILPHTLGFIAMSIMSTPQHVNPL